MTREGMRRTGFPRRAWLRLTSFTASRTLDDDEVLAPKLAERLARDYAALAPLVAALAEAERGRAAGRD